MLDEYVAVLFGDFEMRGATDYQNRLDQFVASPPNGDPAPDPNLPRERASITLSAGRNKART